MKKKQSQMIVIFLTNQVKAWSRDSINMQKLERIKYSHIPL